MFRISYFFEIKKENVDHSNIYFHYFHKKIATLMSDDLFFTNEPPGTRTPEVTLKPQKNKGLRIIKK